jgi:hypothetical protein
MHRLVAALLIVFAILVLVVAMAGGRLFAVSPLYLALTLAFAAFLIDDLPLKRG